MHGSSQGSRPQPIPTWRLSQAANPLLPPSPSCLMMPPPITTKQHSGLTNRALPPVLPTANHVLPLVSAAASPLAAAAHQSQCEGVCAEPIRSCCLPSVPANQGQPHPARSYKSPSSLGLSQQLGSSQGGGAGVLWKGVPLEKAPTCSVPEGCGWNMVVFWCPVPQGPSESKMPEGLLTWVMSWGRDQEQQERACRSRAS